MKTIEEQLIIRSTVLFPRKSYLSMPSVRHARRQWVAAQLILAARQEVVDLPLDLPMFLTNQAG